MEDSFSGIFMVRTVINGLINDFEWMLVRFWPRIGEKETELDGVWNVVLVARKLWINGIKLFFCSEKLISLLGRCGRGDYNIVVVIAMLYDTANVVSVGFAKLSPFQMYIQRACPTWCMIQKQETRCLQRP